MRIFLKTRLTAYGKKFTAMNGSDNSRRELISIILPVVNGEKYLAQSIKSCLDQTYANLELIIVNDCSTDGSLVIAESFAAKDERVRVISNNNNE